MVYFIITNAILVILNQNQQIVFKCYVVTTEKNNIQLFQINLVVFKVFAFV